MKLNGPMLASVKSKKLEANSEFNASQREIKSQLQLMTLYQHLMSLNQYDHTSISLTATLFSDNISQFTSHVF